MPRRAYSYARFSSSRQRKGSSLQRQDEWAQQICSENSWLLDQDLRFIDKARSGYKGDNLKPTADLARFLDLVERRRITPGSVLLVENIDRLSRQEVDVAYDLFRGILRAGIWIATKIPSRIYKKETNSFMDLMEPIWSMYLAHEESVKKSDRSNGAWRKARAAAMQGRRIPMADHPAWLRPTVDGFEVIPERVDVIRYIFRLSVDGLGCHRIAERLTAEGVACWGRSGRWQDQYIRRILAGRQARGEHQPCDKDGKPIGSVLQDYYPAIVDEPTWLRSRAQLTRRQLAIGRPGVGFTNLFRSMVYDAESRRTLCIRSHNTAGKKYPYLAFERHRGSGIPYYPFEDAVLEALAMLRPEDVLEPVERNAEREDRIASLSRKQTKLWDRILFFQKEAADLDKDPTLIRPILDDLCQQHQAVSQELDVLRLESLSSRTEALTECQTLRHLRAGLDGEERREMDRRIQAAVPGVVSEIWVQLQKVTERTQIVHIQIWLRSGECRYLHLLPGKLHGQEPWDMLDWDLRRAPYCPRSKKGHVADQAPGA